MNHDEAKQRFMLLLRCGQTEVFDHDQLTPAEAREYQALCRAFGAPNADQYYEQMDAITAHLAGCLDPAPPWVTDEYHLDPGATWHEVWRERTTDYLMDHCPAGYATQLYRTYVQDVAVTQPGQPTSKLGFRDWMEAQTWDMAFMVDVLNQIIDDPVELPS
jgi:hypothetical protein